MDKQTLLTIAMSLLLAWGCSYVARRRGRNPMIWLAAGALFGILALIALFILPVVKSAAARAAAPSPPRLALISPLHAEKFWYFLDEQKQQFGPMSFDALSRARLAGTVKEQTFVWNEAMENWQHFKDVIQMQPASTSEVNRATS